MQAATVKTNTAAYNHTFFAMVILPSQVKTTFLLAWTAAVRTSRVAAGYDDFGNLSSVQRSGTSTTGVAPQAGVPGRPPA